MLGHEPIGDDSAEHCHAYAYNFSAKLLYFRKQSAATMSSFSVMEEQSSVRSLPHSKNEEVKDLSFVL